MRRGNLMRLALLFGIVLTACNRDPKVQKQKYYDSAIELIKKGNVPKAVLQLRNALKIDPKFVEAANVLAEIEARQGNYREAYRLLQQVENAKPDYLPARKGLSQLYKLSGKMAEAQGEMEYILERTPDDTDTLFNLGTIQVNQKKFKEAEGTFNRILEIQQSHVPALLALASLKQKTEDLPGAERYLKLALERNPRSIAVYLTVIRFYISYRRSDVEPLFTQALKVSNNNLEILEAQDGYYEGSGKLAEAAEVVRKIQSLHSRDPKFRGALADFYVRTGNLEKAKAELERLLSQRADDPPTLHKLIEAHLDLNDRKGAEALNDALLKKNPKDGYAHLLKGRLYLADGEIDQALAQFSQTQQSQPDYAALHYWYAKAYLQRRDFRLAKQSLETALRCDPNYQAARLELAQIQNQTGAVDVAIANAQKLLLNNPNDTAAMLVYSQSLLAKQKYAEAEKIVKQVAARTPNNPEAHRQLGILSLVAKNVPTAQKEFKQAWALEPGSKSLLEAVLMSYLVEKQAGTATDFLQREIQARSNDPLLYHELAQIYLVLGKRGEAVAALQKALTLAPSNADSALLLADAYATTNQPDTAAALVTDLMKKHWQDTDVILRAGMLFEKVQRWDDAQAAYKRVMQLDSDHAIAKNNLAWLLASHGGNIDVALSLAQQAKEKLVDDLQVTDTIGWIYYQKKVYGTALFYLKQCVEKDQTNATFQYQLGLTYFHLGDTGAARRALMKALTLDPHFAEAATVRETLSNL